MVLSSSASLHYSQAGRLPRWGLTCHLLVWDHTTELHRSPVASVYIRCQLLASPALLLHRGLALSGGVQGHLGAKL